MIIQHNIAGINSARNKGISEFRMGKSLEKLSSGYRINRAGDDAAGLAISELMRNQITALDQAMRNVNDGISMTQTGDGALNEIHAMLERMKTLAIEAANGTYNSMSRASLDAERIQLMDEIDRIGRSSDFDEIELFNGATEPPDAPATFSPPERDMRGDITLQIGHSGEETMDVTRYYMSGKALGLDKTDFTSVNSANESVQMIEDAIEAVADIRADFGASYNHLEHTHNNLSVTSENMTTSESRIRDTNMAEEFTEFTKSNIVYQASNSMCAQSNSMPQLIISLLQ